MARPIYTQLAPVERHLEARRLAEFQIDVAPTELGAFFFCVVSYKDFAPTEL